MKSSDRCIRVLPITRYAREVIADARACDTDLLEYPLVESNRNIRDKR